MLKAHERTLGYLQKLLDFSLAGLIWLFVYWIRFYLIPNAQQGLDESFIRAGVVVGLLTVYFFSKDGLYRSHRLSSLHEEMVKVFKSNSYACISFVVLFYFLADERLSRSVVFIYFVLSTITFLFFKVSIRSFLRSLRRKGRNLRHIMLVGNSKALVQYVENIRAFPECGVRFSGWIDSHGLAEKYGVEAFDFAVVTSPSRLSPDSFVIGYQGEESIKADLILREIYNDVVPIVVLPDLTYSFVGYQVDRIAGVPALVVNQPDFSTVDVVLKRFFDIVVSGIGLIVISPVLLLIAIGVKLSSSGPVFFGQERIGLDGHRFKMWKFRSMKVGGHLGANGVPGWTTKDDPRKTKFGSFIRATSLDELPQLWNAFVGDMSMVGPRPEQPYFVEKFRNEIPAYMLRHKMRAGITGWAQVNGWRGDTSLHKRIECDLYYIRNWSIWFDVKIILLTFWRGFINKNAY